MAISEKRERESTKSILQGRVFIPILEVIPFCHNEKTKLLVLTPNQARPLLLLLGRSWPQKTVVNLSKPAEQSLESERGAINQIYMVFLTDSFESNNGFFIFPDILQTSMFIKRRHIDLIIVRYAYNNHTLIIHV